MKIYSKKQNKKQQKSIFQQDSLAMQWFHGFDLFEKEFNLQK